MIWLLLLGLITYFIVRRVHGITRTPVWLLWLVAMTPALILSAWAIAFRGQRSMPPEFVIALFVGCLVLYLFLIQQGRIAPRPTKPVRGDTTSSSAEPQQPPNLEPVLEQDAEQHPLRPITKEE